MKKKQKAYITLYLTLTIAVMLSLAFVLLEGAREETMRLETETVMDLSLYSVFGEYHRQLLEQYDLFFIDTSYGQQSPKITRSEERLLYYMNENFHKNPSYGIGSIDLTDLSCDNVTFECYQYASDCQGMVVKRQMVNYMKNKLGMETAEDILREFDVIQTEDILSKDISKEWDEQDAKLNKMVDEKKKEANKNQETKQEEIKLGNPASKVKEIKAQGILGLAVPPEKKISGMIIHPDYYLSHRDISQGTGILKHEDTFVDQVLENYLFREYLLEKCGSYHKNKDNSVLKYQIEYLLYGKEGDLENLEAAVEEILHIREAINFLYLLSDSQKVSEADTLAGVISLVLFSPEIKDAVKVTLLFAWSYAESVKDMRILLDGNKLPIWKTKESWNTPLSQLAMFSSFLDKYEVKGEGVSYEDYLRFFLSMKKEKELLFRFMDLCEMDIRITEGNEYFRMDGCINAVKAKVNVSSGYGNGYEITRTYSYE